MNFEKYKDPYKSLQIGIKNNPLTIIEAGYTDKYRTQKMWNSTYHSLNSNQLNQLLNFIESAKNLKIKNYYSIIENISFKIINEKKLYEGRRFKTIKELMGKFVKIKFENRIFEIPTNLNLND